MKNIIIGIIIVCSLFLAGCKSNDGVFCTMDAKLCSDGSYVSREGPDCEFKKCPAFEGMTLEEALEIASNSDCIKEGDIGFNGYYNKNSKTWWIDFEPFETKENCNPKCVVSTEGAEINWMCTGLVES